MVKIKATLISERVSSNTVEARNLFTLSRFGEKYEDKILYSLSEALFLVQDKKMYIVNYYGKKLSQKEILKRFERIDKKFKTKYMVFRDLRKKGYIVKTALKFGAEFRVYKKGKKIDRVHSDWILFPVSENKRLTWQNFSAKSRVAHSTKKNLLIAVVDDEGCVSYYEIKWMQL